MSVFWIAVAVTVPTALAFLVAWPLWLKAREVIVGNIVGALIITVSVFALIAREYIQVERIRRRCEELTGGVCAAPTADVFMRFAVYGFIGLIETMALFVVSDILDHRRRRSGYAPEWR